MKPLLKILLLINAILIGETARMCPNVDPRLTIPCMCEKNNADAVSITCDNVVFRNDFPELPFLTNIVEYRQRHSGLQDLTSQVFGGSQLALKKVDFSKNEIRAMHGRVFEGLEDDLEVLLLDHNKITDDASSDGLFLKEVSKLRALKTLNLGHNEVRSLDVSLLKNLSLLQVLHLHGNLLQQVPTNALKGPKDLKVLTLQENSIMDLQIDSFTTTPELIFLNVSHNKLNFIQNGAFRGLTNLSALDLSYNRLNEVSPNSFLGLENLELLDLSSNFFQDVPADSLKHLLSLKSLILKNNQIQNLGGIVALGPASTLKILDLSRNHIVNLEANTFRRLTGLETLKMSINSVGERNDNTFTGLDALQSLELADLKFFSFPTRMLSKTRSLKYLNLDHNRIRVITYLNLRPIYGIVKLSIAHNIIQEIPSDLFRNFTRLTSLNLFKNNIANIPANIFHPIRTVLTELNLGSNALSFLPRFNLPVLTKLTLSGNQLTTLPDGAFDYLPKLKVLDLSKNSLISVGASTFLPLSRLETLDLSLNKLSVIETGLFNGTVINFINLRGNQIQKISSKAFKGLLFLSSLDLSDNHIETIEAGAFHDSTFIHILNLSKNRLSSFKKEFFELPRSPTTHLRYLDLSQNDITYLPTDSLFPHPRLIWLSLAENRLSFFPTSVLSNHAEMSQLNLSRNFIDQISDSDFANSNSLTELDLSYNNIKDISETAFQNSTQLQELNLAHNNLQQLYPNSFLGIARLKIDLSHNRLNGFPQTIFDRSKLKLVSLNIAHNQFDNVPALALRPQNSIFNDLNMAHNNVSDIPKKDDALVNMRSLDLSYNPLTPLDVLELLNEPKLTRHLNLAGVNINDIPLIEARFLTSLNLSDNNIDELSGEKVKLIHNLQTLDLSSNEIPNVQHALSSAWPQLPNLRSLSITHNPIKFIANGDFKELSQLEILRASHLPKLTRIERSSLENLSLKELYMYDYPKVKSIDAQNILNNMRGLEKVDMELSSPVVDDDLHGIFSPRLEHLFVRGPRVQKLESTAFLNLNSPRMDLGIIGTNVSTLDEGMLFLVPMSSEINLILNDSQITTLSEDFLENVILPRQDQLNLLGLDSNPLYCDCNLKQLKSWIDKHKTQLSDSVVCSGPKKLRGKRVADLKPEQLICDLSTPRQRPEIIKNNLDNIITKDELDRKYPKLKEEPTKTDQEKLSFSGMDKLIIGIVGGVIGFVALVIFIFVLVKYCCDPQRKEHLHPFHLNGNCTCVKPPLPSMGYHGPYSIPPGSRAGTLKSMPPTTPVPPPYGTMKGHSTSSYYSGPPSYMGYPPEDHDYR